MLPFHPFFLLLEVVVVIGPTTKTFFRIFSRLGMLADKLGRIAGVCELWFSPLLLPRHISVGIILKKECIPEHQVETKLRLTRSPLSQALRFSSTKKLWWSTEEFVFVVEEGVFHAFNDSPSIGSRDSSVEDVFRAKFGLGPKPAGIICQTSVGLAVRDYKMVAKKVCLECQPRVSKNATKDIEIGSLYVALSRIQ